MKWNWPWQNNMKWPASVKLIRHDTSVFNALRGKKNADPLYQQFVAAWDENPTSAKTVNLALRVRDKFALGISDADTPLDDDEGTQAFQTGVALRQGVLPDVIYVSPYNRTLLTLKHITRGWPELAKVTTYEEERIREQEHGLSSVYNDWRVFQTLNPDQLALYRLEGQYWYRYPQGENVPDVRDRVRAWVSTIMRDFAGKNVLAVTHHLNILAIRANLERWDAAKFLRIDREDKPINCGVTTYRGNPWQGKNGRLLLETYNVRHYE